MIIIYLKIEKNKNIIILYLYKLCSSYYYDKLSLLLFNSSSACLVAATINAVKVVSFPRIASSTLSIWKSNATLSCWWNYRYFKTIHSNLLILIINKLSKYICNAFELHLNHIQKSILIYYKVVIIKSMSKFVNKFQQILK